MVTELLAVPQPSADQDLQEDCDSNYEPDGPPAAMHNSSGGRILPVTGAVAHNAVTSMLTCDSETFRALASTNTDPSCTNADAAVVHG